MVSAGNDNAANSEELTACRSVFTPLQVPTPATKQALCTNKRELTRAMSITTKGARIGERAIAAVAVCIPGGRPGKSVAAIAAESSVSEKTTAAVLRVMRGRGRVSRYRERGAYLYHYKSDAFSVRSRQ